jgi:nitrogen fixation/metabolism regulation signal transduction histidine kinase
MRRVSVNIAKNAMEAMYDGQKEYCFTIKSEKRENSTKDEIVISFIDNGSGLPETIERRIFEIFASEGKTKGTGLGLFMCKWIVGEHNGDLKYEI